MCTQVTFHDPLNYDQSIELNKRALRELLGVSALIASNGIDLDNSDEGCFCGVDIKASVDQSEKTFICFEDHSGDLSFCPGDYVITSLNAITKGLEALYDQKNKEKEVSTSFPAKWIPAETINSKDQKDLWFIELQVRVVLDCDGKKDIYVVAAKYTGKHWYLSNSSECVEGIVTHYMPMAKP